MNESTPELSNLQAALRCAGCGKLPSHEWLIEHVLPALQYPDDSIDIIGVKDIPVHLSTKYGSLSKDLKLLLPCNHYNHAPWQPLLDAFHADVDLLSQDS